MVLVSSPQSMRRDKPSLLALAETIAATGISLWLAWKHNSVEHIVIASAIAPFLLLRTRLSTRYTIRVMGTFLHRREDTYYRSLVVLLVPLIKTICTARVVFRKPVNSILTIPRNFYATVFVLNLRIAPQIIPRSEEVKLNEFDVYAITKDLLQMVRQTLQNRVPMLLRITGLVIILIFTICYFLPLFIAALSFRFAIKSTALLWLPLLWIIYQSRAGTNVQDALKVAVEEPWTELVRRYSLCVIVAFVLKVTSYIAAWDMMNFQSLGELGLFGKGIVAPLDLPMWHVTSAINAGLAWGFYFRAKRHLLAQNLSVAWPRNWIAREYVAFQAVRTTFTLYAIFCTLYIAAFTAWQAPPIHFILIPRVYTYPTGLTSGP